jgi:hypothetical protein
LPGTDEQPKRRSVLTKKVRIENADTSDFKVVVRVYEKAFEEGVPDELIHEEKLINPCDMTGEDLVITDSRYVVITES